MRFFASWWERLPVRQMAPVLMSLIGAFGAFHAAGHIRAVVGPVGMLWG